MLRLPTGLRGHTRTPKQVEILRNCYAVPGENAFISTRPVAVQAGTSLGKCRGIGLFKDELYMVSNDRLVKITLTDPTLPPAGNLTVTDIGEIAGSARCELVSGYTAMCIMVIGGAGYIYDSVNGLQEITDPAYMASVSVAYDAGRFIFQPETGGPFLWTELANPAAINPTNFADAEEFPDLNKAVAVKRKSLYVAGSRSFERLQYDPELDTYKVISGASSAVGYIGGMTDFDEMFLFIGPGVNGGFSVYAMEASATPISNEAVDNILSEYTASELEGVNAQSFKREGIEFALFYLPRHTLCFYGDWSIWHSGVAGDGLTWSVQFFQFCYGYLFTGDIDGLQIGIIDEAQNEYTGPVEGTLRTFIRGEPRTGQMISRVTASVNPGQTSTPASIGLSVSTDGVTYGPVQYKSLGTLGDYAREISWGRPVAKINDFLGLNITWRGPMQLTIDMLSYE